MYLSKFVTDYGIVRDYNGNGFKLVELNYYKPGGFEDRKFTAKGEAGNDTKLYNNIVRARSRIFELALCNPWEWFVTLTLDPKKYDRKDLAKFIKDLSQMIRDYRKKNGITVKYLLIPEHHKDGCWHLHGLFMGLPEERLCKFQANQHLPVRILERIEQGVPVYTWVDYAVRFGYCVFEPVKNPTAVSKYITKYITKEMLNTIRELNAHSFYASQNLQRSEVIMQDQLVRPIAEPDYKNDHCSVKWFEDICDALSFFREAVSV